MTRDDWHTLREDWDDVEAEAGPIISTDASTTTRKPSWPRSFATILMGEALLVLAALGGVAAALWHAADAGEVVLGSSVGLAILSAWLLQTMSRRQELTGAGSTSMEYLELLRRLSERQLQFVRFACVIVALELSFLAVWWADGLAEHHGQLGSSIAMISLWLPMIALGAFVFWTVRLRATASATLQRIRRLKSQLDEG